MMHVWTHPQQPDPIHAAIERHCAAYGAYQIAPEGYASVEASNDYDVASDALTITACTTRFGALALLAHLRWWLTEEAEFAAGHQPAYGIAQTRAADLTLFLGTNLPPVVMPQAMPLGHLTFGIVRRLSLFETSRGLLPSVDHGSEHASSTLGEVLLSGPELWEANAPTPLGAEHARLSRTLRSLGEMLAAVLVIGGGMVLTGFATLL